MNCSSALRPAIIYCRVSSEKQATEGNGLTSQETSCRHYAVDHGYEVIEVFTDDYTGGGDFWKRPGITALLKFLDSQDGEVAVIFDDLKRFARDTMFHLQLRKELSSRNAVPRCPNFRFEETPEGHFVETIIAATAELERKQNRRQVISRMKARFEAGYWVFPVPLGYRYERVNGDRRPVPDPATADVARTALIDFSTGRLVTQADVLRFLRTSGCSSRYSKDTSYSKQAIRNFLSNEFYMGWCVAKKWNMRVKGVHEPLITLEQHQQILERLKPLPCDRPHTRKSADFPLRGFLQCGTCGRYLTSCWTQGRNEQYPYYRCQTKQCAGSISRGFLEKRFSKLLEGIELKESAIALFQRVLEEMINQGGLLRKQQENQKKRRLKAIVSEIEQFVEVIGRSQSATAQRVYEQKISQLEEERQRLEATSPDTSSLDITPVFEQGREFLRSPLECWRNGDLDRQRALQNLVFEGPIIYHSKSAHYTAQYSLLVRLLGSSGRGESSLVDAIGGNLHPVAEEIKRWTEILNNYFQRDAG